MAKNCIVLKWDRFLCKLIVYSIYDMILERKEECRNSLFGYDIIEM